MDRTYAERAAGGTPAYSSQQVWLAPGALARVRPALRAAGVRINGVVSAGAQRAQLARQGPALATVLFLADAAAAAALAAGAAITGLYASGRRRRYEYAALLASRVPRRSIRASLLAEQAIVLGFGVVIGLAAGFAATVLAVRSVPEFITQPQAPPLSYLPPIGGLALLVAAALAVLVLAAVAASMLLVRSVRPDCCGRLSRDRARTRRRPSSRRPCRSRSAVTTWCTSTGRPAPRWPRCAGWT